MSGPDIRLGLYIQLLAILIVCLIFAVDTPSVFAVEAFVLHRGRATQEQLPVRWFWARLVKGCRWWFWRRWIGRSVVWG
ncbi:hypothetical protein BS50DRAFT_568094 [Corynespora cassiicola Philippines]|uniref:Uncharacterized protein n=1 Tax=Corynespora cassiicola Philippines TaxID=1448308 RepID=A0A2T2PCN8_CORCC|nr:hypothetical protein BS50DRAFT_568094 [Corynespora cassiicola Philippines]